MPVPGVLGTAVLRLETDNTKLISGLKAAEASAKGLGMVGAAVGAAFIGGLGLAVKAAIDFESAFAGVRKTVDGTEAELDAISDALREMAKEMPASLNELARIGEAAGQVGVAKEDIVEFTRTMAMLGETTNIVAEQAATDMARFMNVMQTAPGDVDNLASALVALGNAGASTEQEILTMATRISGAAAVVGLTEQEVLGFSNALSSMGIQAEAGGTAFSKVLQTIHEAVLTQGSDLEALAVTAGMTSEAFTQLWSEDKAAAIIAFTAGLGAVDEAGGNVYATLEQLGLSDARVTRMLLAMAGNSVLVADSVNLANTAFEDNTALQDEYAKRVETTAAQLEIAKNRLIDVAITVGSVLLPAIADAAGVFGELADGIADGFEALPESTQQLVIMGGAAAAIVPLLVKAGAAAITMGQNFRAGQLMMTGWIGVALAAVIAANNLSEVLTGKGLIDWAKDIFGGDDGYKVGERTVEVVHALSAELGNLSSSGEQLELLDERFKALGDSMNDHTTDMEEAAHEAFALGRAHGQLGLSTETLTANSEKLGESSKYLQGIYEQGIGSVEDLEGKQTAYAESVARTAENVERAGPSLEQLRSGAMSAAEAFTAAVHPMAEYADEEERAAAEAENLEEQLLSLVGAFADLNPAVLEAQFANARLREELQDMDRAGTDYSENLGMTRAEIEATITANDGFTASMKENQDAVEQFLPYLARFIGEEGFGRLTAEMMAANVPFETQIDVLGRLGDAYTLLGSAEGAGPISQAIGAFAQIKAILGDGPAWDEIAKTAGTDFIAKINAAYEGGLITEEQAAALKAEVAGVVGDANAAGLAKAQETSPAIGTALATGPVHTLTPDPMANALSGAVETAIGSGTATAGTAGPVGAELSESAGAGVTGPPVQGPFDVVVSDAIASATGIASGAGTVGAELSTAASGGITPNPMVGVFDAAMQTTIDSGTGVASGAAPAGAELSTAASLGITPNPMVGVFDAAMETAIASAKGVATGATTAGDQAVTSTAEGMAAQTAADAAAQQMMVDALNQANTAAGNGAFIGASFASGISAGIYGAAQTVANAAAAVARQAVDAAKTILDIFSPSGVAEEEIGAPFVEGIVAGIRKAEDEAWKASAKLSEAMMLGAVSEIPKLLREVRIAYEQLAKLREVGDAAAAAVGEAATNTYASVRASLEEMSGVGEEVFAGLEAWFEELDAAAREAGDGIGHDFMDAWAAALRASGDLPIETTYSLLANLLEQLHSGSYSQAFYDYGTEQIAQWVQALKDGEGIANAAVADFMEEMSMETELVKQQTAAWDKLTETTDLKLAEWNDALQHGLDISQSMTHDQITAMLADIYETVQAAPFPEEFKSKTTEAIALMVQALVSGQGLANSAVQALIDSVVAQFATMPAAVQAAVETGAKPMQPATVGGGERIAEGTFDPTRNAYWNGYFWQAEPYKRGSDFGTKVAPAYDWRRGGPAVNDTRVIDGETYYFHGYRDGQESWSNFPQGPATAGGVNRTPTTSEGTVDYSKIKTVYFPDTRDATPLATGGIVRQKTLAWLGESGPELVLPLSRAAGYSSEIRSAVMAALPRRLAALADSWQNNPAMSSPSFQAIFNIEGNADVDALREALNRWWNERVQFEFGVLARRDAVGF